MSTFHYQPTPVDRIYFDSCVRQIPRYSLRITKLRAKLEMFTEELYICKNPGVRKLIKRRIAELREEIKQHE